MPFCTIQDSFRLLILVSSVSSFRRDLCSGSFYLILTECSTCLRHNQALLLLSCWVSEVQEKTIGLQSEYTRFWTLDDERGSFGAWVSLRHIIVWYDSHSIVNVSSWLEIQLLSFSSLSLLDTYLKTLWSCSEVASLKTLKLLWSVTLMHQ